MASPDFVGADSGIFEGLADGVGGTNAPDLVAEHGVGVVVGSEAEDFEDGLGTSGEGGLFGFEHPEGRSFAGNGAVAVGAEGGNAVGGAGEAQLREAEGGFVADFFHAAREQKFGAAETQEFGGVVDGVETAREAGADGGIDAAEFVLDGGLTGGGVDDGVGKIERADEGGAVGDAGPIEGGDAVDAAEYGAADEAQAGVILRSIGLV